MTLKGISPVDDDDAGLKFTHGCIVGILGSTVFWLWLSILFRHVWLK
jgi:hypothetical protein